jgi:hypothetical protein
MKAKELKGVYNLNPTKAVMKLGGEQQREANRAGPKRVGGTRMSEAHEAGADLESVAHEHSHPAMKTRHSHPAEHKHADGRKHEDHHHAVKQAKGKM